MFCLHSKTYSIDRHKGNPISNGFPGIVSNDTVCSDAMALNYRKVFVISGCQESTAQIEKLPDGRYSDPPAIGFQWKDFDYSLYPLTKCPND